MSTLITTAFVQQYRANVMLLFQQQGSKLRGMTRMETVNAKFHFFERLASTAAVKKTVRHSDTPLVNSQHSRRRVGLVDFEWADLVDLVDKIRLLITPESEYAVNASWALGRALDDEIISAYNGVAKAGENGEIDVPFPASQVIVDGGTGMTIDKLREAKQRLDSADAPEGDRMIVISPIALQDLLETTEVTSSDFNSIKALVSGDLNTYLGMRFIMSTRLPKVGDIRSCFVWHKNSMALAMGKDMNSRITERPDKSFSVQVFASGTWAATRLEEEGVVQVDVDETA